jgi:hypothetical protein
MAGVGNPAAASMVSGNCNELAVGKEFFLVIFLLPFAEEKEGNFMGCG